MTESGHYAKLSEIPKDSERIFKRSDLKSSGYTPTCIYDFEFNGRTVKSKGRKSWRTNASGMVCLIKAARLFNLGASTYFRQYFSDAPMKQMENTWTDTAAGFSDTKTYVVQTHDKIVTRCVLMTTDPRRSRARPDLRFRHHRHGRRAMGAPLDHHRYVACRIGR